MGFNYYREEIELSSAALTFARTDFIVLRIEFALLKFKIIQ